VYNLPVKLILVTVLRQQRPWQACHDADLFSVVTSLGRVLNLQTIYPYFQKDQTRSATSRVWYIKPMLKHFLNLLHWEAISVTALSGFGLALLSLNEFLAARFCFWGATLVAILGATMYAHGNFANFKSRLLAGAILLGLILGFQIWCVTPWTRTLELKTQTSTSAETSNATKVKTESLRELLLADFPNLLKQSVEFASVTTAQNGVRRTSIVGVQYDDFAAQSKFYGFYVPQSQDSFDICKSLIKELPVLEKSFQSVDVKTKSPGDSDLILSKKLNFSKMVYLYYEDYFSTEQRGEIAKAYRLHGLTVQLRGPEYRTSRWLQDNEQQKK
jgi:hypothetical protein